MKNTIIIITEEQYRTLQGEAASTSHFQERKDSRLYGILDLNQADIAAVEQAVSNVMATDYPKSTAIRLHQIQVDPKSKYVIYSHGKNFYRIPEGTLSAKRGTILKKSVGDEFWAVVRKNQMITFLLRRSNDGGTPEAIKKILRVDEVIM